MATGDGGITITNNPKLGRRMALFMDKGWNRKKTKFGPRAYLFLGPNYRMNELTGAVALAQLKKVEKVVNKRKELGNLLSNLIKNIPGIKPAPITSGGMHSYWAYPLWIEKGNVSKFAKALTAEGVPAGAGYIGKPIYLCNEALCKKRTYGNSHCPFDCPKYGKKIEYKEGMCPQTEEVLKHLVTFVFHEYYSKKDIRDIAKAIQKVAIGLRRKK